MGEARPDGCEAAAFDHCVVREVGVIEFRNLPDHAPHRTKGLLIHLPASGPATVHWINLQAGYLGAMQAHIVRTWRDLDDLASDPIAVRP